MSNQTTSRSGWIDSSQEGYSVLMSVYAKDDPGFLDAAMQSMVDQTVPFHDMVLVCDGPLTPGLDDAVGAWQGRLGGRLDVVRLPENGGLGNALTAGLPRCGCDMVARMDADDMSRPGRCGALLAAMREGDLDLVGGAIEEFESVPGDLGAVRRLPAGETEIRRFAARRNPFNHVTVMFRRRAVEEAGGYQPFHLLEDYWLWARMLARGCRCANVPDVVVDVRVGTGMYGRRSNIVYLRSQYRLFREMHRIGISDTSDVIITLVARTISTSIPTASLKMLYKAMLRDKK